MGLCRHFWIPTFAGTSGPASNHHALAFGEDEQDFLVKWVGAVARRIDAPHAVLRKTRHGDLDVEVSVPDLERWRAHTPVLVDGIVSTGRTMIATLRHLAGRGTLPPTCIAVHGIFAGTAYRELLDAGASCVATCNTIPHHSNAIDVTQVLADAVAEHISPR